jgi:hypothetical protein
MHSYGVHESLGKIAREKKVLLGGVMGLVYMCALLLPEGDSLWSVFGWEGAPVYNCACKYHPVYFIERVPFHPEFSISGRSSLFKQDCHFQTELPFSAKFALPGNCLAHGIEGVN